MELKLTLQGLLIYIPLWLYLLAAVVTLVRKRRLGLTLYGLGFLVALAAYIYRGLHVGHWPLQNLFEVTLLLGVLSFPVSIFCRYVLKIGGQAADMFLGALILVPAGFVFHAEPQLLPPALQSPLFVPHVGVYMISYLLMAKACICAVAQLCGLSSEENTLAPEPATYVMVCLGFPFLTLGLILGSWWGKLAWSDYWAWDPKELWSLTSWLAFVGYFHFRYMFGTKHPRWNSIWVIVGMIFILITYFWVNLSKLFPGLHNYAT